MPEREFAESRSRRCQSPTEWPISTQPISGAPLLLFNSWSREIESFQPLDPDRVRIYSCGPTVYNYAHLGNLRAYVFTDLLRRTLNWKGWSVNHVINITDVGHLTSDQDTGEDKLEVAAARQQRDIWQIAAYYTDAFKRDLNALGILAPSIWSTATDHIEDMVEFALVLERHGVTYEIDSGLYFDTSRVPHYGRLALIERDARVEGARVEVVPGKRNPTDFAVWRRSPEPGKRQMEWASPWGTGAPGWHLECSVMSMKYLGERFDIHTGGIDHREVHHCNEIAQNQAYTGTGSPAATFWMHNNFLIDRTGKMSKSKGDFTTLQTLVDMGVHPLAFRLMCLSANYRNELEFTYTSLLAALKRLKRLVKAVEELRKAVGNVEWLAPVREIAYSRGASFGYQRSVLEQGLPDAARALVAAYDAALSADLMTPNCLTVLDEAMQDKALSPQQRLRVIASLDLTLGLRLIDLTSRDLSLRPADAALTDAEVERHVEEREEARRRRDFATADRLRDELGTVGVSLMDTERRGMWEWVPRIPDA
jgi:cysteinyl-tRNA synthetase